MTKYTPEEMAEKVYGKRPDLCPSCHRQLLECTCHTGLIKKYDESVVTEEVVERVKEIIPPLLPEVEEPILLYEPPRNLGPKTKKRRR